MRRFGQFIRQAGHFGKRSVWLETPHQIGGTSASFDKHCFRRRGRFVLKTDGDDDMKTVTKEFRVPAGMALMFAILSVFSTAVTAVMPVLN
jgi:hypothetical protein